MNRVAIAMACSGIVSIALAWRFWVRDRPQPWPDHESRCDGFDFPVGAPDASRYYDAQPFGVNTHLGHDWNGLGGGDTDLGDPVYAVAAGIVLDAHDEAGGWGNVIRIVHGCRIESVYAHLDTMEIATGLPVYRGQRIGTIGTAHGLYPAHLHFELRDRPLPLGGGYSADPTGFLDATQYINAHRPEPAKRD